MTPELLNEPELEFGGGYKHIDIRFGIQGYGPFDVELEHAPKRIRVGFVGTEKTQEKFISWLERCRNGIAAKDGNKPNLFPPFPGLGEDVALRCKVVTDSALQRAILYAKIRGIIEIEDHKPGNILTTFKEERGAEELHAVDRWVAQRLQEFGGHECGNVMLLTVQDPGDLLGVEPGRRTS